MQLALERYFAERGFKQLPGGHADLVCEESASGERWLIEAKGLTTEVGLDFRTGLGQLIQRMQQANTQYGLGVPDLPQFRSQCAQVPQRVRELLGIHWLLVDRQGKVRVLTPSELLA